MKLKTYLVENKIKSKDLAKQLDVAESTITRMIKRGAIVINGVIYTPQYEIKNDWYYTLHNNGIITDRRRGVGVSVDVCRRVTINKQ